MSLDEYRNQALLHLPTAEYVFLSQLRNTTLSSCLIAAVENTGFTLVLLFRCHLTFHLYTCTHNIYSVTHQSVGFTIKAQRECHFCMSAFEQLLFSLCLSLSYSINVKHNNKCIRSEHWLLSYPDTPCLSLIPIKREVVPGPFSCSSELANRALTFCKGLCTAFHDCNICAPAPYLCF